MKFMVMGLVIAAACHHDEPARTPTPQLPVADSVPELICHKVEPSTLRGVDPQQGGYRVLADDATLQAVRGAMQHGTLVRSADQQSRSMRALWGAWDDVRPDVEACMIHADGSKPAMEYSIRIALSGNSVASLIRDISIQRVVGVNPDLSPVLARTDAEPCIQHLLGRVELPPGDWAAESSTIVRQDFCTPTVEIALRSTHEYVDSYMTWWRGHSAQACPTGLAELASYRADNGIDPWHQPYVMRCDANGFQVLSAGPDRKLGTADDIESHR